MKNCGNCGYCCYFAEIKEINKPSNSWCPYYKNDLGCSIYNTRPKSCKEYICLWYVNENLLIELRPDNCGIVFEKVGNSKVFLGLLIENQAIENKIVIKLINKLLVMGYSVAIYNENNFSKIYFAKGHTIEYILNEMIKVLNRI